MQQISINDSTSWIDLVFGSKKQEVMAHDVKTRDVNKT